MIVKIMLKFNIKRNTKEHFSAQTVFIFIFES